MVKVEDIIVLINEYRLHTDSSKDLVRTFSPFLSEFSLVRERSRKIARVQAPEFNIFDLLGVARDEVHTHSSIIADLLNPSGRHGQGTLFLDAFVEIGLEKAPENSALREFIQSPNRHESSVLTEMHSQFGRLDIVILNPSIGFLCVIENKVGAIEQVQQLERYNLWMNTMHQDYPLHTLVFLTIKGNLAATASNQEYIPISYNHDVVGWLDTTLPTVEAPNVKVILQQYCEIARRL